MLQLIGNPCYKDKDSQESHRVYLNPSKYPFTDEFSTISSIPGDALLNVQTQKR